MLGYALSLESLGSRFTRSPEFEAFRAGGLRQGMVFSQSFETRAVTAEAIGPRERLAEIVVIPKRRPRLRDVLTVVQTMASSIEFVQQTGYTSGADMVSEGAQKPQAQFDYEVMTAPVRTIPHWFPASRQVLDDVSGLEAAIDADLITGLELQEEAQILYGDGTGSNLLGVIPQAAALSVIPGVDAPTPMDRVAMGIKQLIDLGLEPDSQGRYYSANGPFGMSPGMLWNRTVIPTPALNAGEFLVGAWAVGASLHDRMQANVLISTEDRDNFIKNMVTILGEERVALAVRKPQAFVTGSLSVASSGSQGVQETDVRWTAGDDLALSLTQRCYLIQVSSGAPNATTFDALA